MAFFLCSFNRNAFPNVRNEPNGLRIHVIQTATSLYLRRLLRTSMCRVEKTVKNVRYTQYVVLQRQLQKNIMNIRQEQNGNTVIITLEGSLDAVHAPTVEATCREFLNNCPEYIILDGRYWDFVSETGLQALLTLLKELKRHSTVALVHPTPLVKQIFGISGFSECFTYYETLEEAKRVLKGKK